MIMLAIKEKNEELNQVNGEFSRVKSDYTTSNGSPNNFLEKLQRSMNALTHRLNKNMNKKVSFHLGRNQTATEFVKQTVQVKKKRKLSLNQKKKKRQAYKAKVKIKRQNKIKDLAREKMDHEPSEKRNQALDSHGARTAPVDSLHAVKVSFVV